MTKEEKIKYAMAFLAPLLFEKEFQVPGDPVQITFPSSLQAEIKVGDGEPQTVKFGLPFRLHDALHQIVDYHITEECKDWERCVHENSEEDMFEEVDGDIVYDPELVADHIYHHLRFYEELIEDYFK
jgi:hypothetical protein